MLSRLAPPTGFEPVTNGLLQWTFHFNSFSLSPRAESAALPLSSRPQTSEGTAARVSAGGNRQPPRNRLLKDTQRHRQDERPVQYGYRSSGDRNETHCRLTMGLVPLA